MSQKLVPPDLTIDERALLHGEGGPALKFAMELVVRAAAIMGAANLIESRFLHIDACHHYGLAHVDFARKLVRGGARFQIPAWTNTITVSLDGFDPRAQSGAGSDQAEARELAGLYEAMGARPVWTCAPYQLPGGPGLGDQIIVGESNAVAFYNAVVGARTNKYGDFLDVACGLVQRVPDAGLHRCENRRAETVIDLSSLPEALKGTEFFCHVLGFYLGRIVGKDIPVIDGLPAATTKDSLKAIAAGAAASGGVTMFHAVGLTPEAPKLSAALQDHGPKTVIKPTPHDLIHARDQLSPVKSGDLAMVALGTPHFSITEFARLARGLEGRTIHPATRLYVSTSRITAHLAKNQGFDEILHRAGVTVLTDTCTYFTPAVEGCRGRVMTNAAKWAYYAPGMLPVDVAFGSLDDCIESAVAGEVRRDPASWADSFWGA